ncbi:MAG: hypothetical protein ABI175_29930 [Polyangiales bacterium]
MRLVLALALLTATGCLQTYDPPPPDPDPYGGWTGPTGDPLYGCSKDAECAPQICARDRGCYPASSVHAGGVRWTIHGMPASSTSCGSTPNLHLSFRSSNGESFGFAPVPCKNGLFSVDKLPTLYTTVELGVENGSSTTMAAIDYETGEALVALP